MLALLPPVVTIGLTLRMKKHARAHKAAADAKRLQNEKYEIADDMDWSNTTACQAKLNLLTVTELKGVAMHLNLERKQLRQSEETDTLRKRLIDLVAEQREKNLQRRSEDEVADGECESASKAAAASGGFLASMAACFGGGDNDE